MFVNCINVSALGDGPIKHAPLTPAPLKGESKIPVQGDMIEESDDGWVQQYGKLNQTLINCK